MSSSMRVRVDYLSREEPYAEALKRERIRVYLYVFKVVGTLPATELNQRVQE